MSVAKVQKWILSALIIVILGILTTGIITYALFATAGRPDAKIGLLAVAGLSGLTSMLAARVIHQWRVLSPWLILGLVPALVGVYLAFWN